MNDLSRAAVAAGIIDVDILKLADPTRPPEAEVAALRKRYPQAFASPAVKLFRDMTPAEQSMFKRKNYIPMRLGQ